MDNDSARRTELRATEVADTLLAERSDFDTVLVERAWVAERGDSASQIVCEIATLLNARDHELFEVRLIWNGARFCDRLFPAWSEAAVEARTTLHDVLRAGWHRVPVASVTTPRPQRQ